MKVRHGGGVRRLGCGGQNLPIYIWLFFQSELAHFRGCLCRSGALGPGEAPIMPCSGWPSVLITMSFLNPLVSSRTKG